MIDMEIELRPFAWGDAIAEEARALRFAVFCDEQGVDRAIEIDEHDPGAAHLAALDDGRVVGTLRLVRVAAKGKIGRVAVARTHRRKGVGAAMMHWAIEQARAMGLTKVVLSGQMDSGPFYESLGFVGTGEIYMEAGIPHRWMVLTL